MEKSDRYIQKVAREFQWLATPALQWIRISDADADRPLPKDGNNLKHHLGSIYRLDFLQVLIPNCCTLEKCW
jgi:hypothetical protein